MKAEVRNVTPSFTEEAPRIYDFGFMISDVLHRVAPRRHRVSHLPAVVGSLIYDFGFMIFNVCKLNCE
jgi:hypothetical protein